MQIETEFVVTTVAYGRMVLEIKIMKPLAYARDTQAFSQIKDLGKFGVGGEGLAKIVYEE